MISQFYYNTITMLPMILQSYYNPITMLPMILQCHCCIVIIALRFNENIVIKGHGIVHIAYRALP
jgi:hypothetical protein